MTKHNSNTESTATTTEATEAVEILTPFGAHKLVNARLEKEGLSKRIPPQMMYNYTSGKLNAGKKPLIAYTPETGVDREAFGVWLEKYVAKQVAAVTPVEAEAEVEDTPAESVESE